MRYVLSAILFFSLYSCQKMVEDRLAPLVGYWVRVDDLAAGDVVDLHFNGTALEGTLVCLSPLAKKAGFALGDLKWRWADIMTLDPDDVQIDNLFSSYQMDGKDKIVIEINKHYRLVSVKLVTPIRLQLMVKEEDRTDSIFWEKLDHLPRNCP